MEKEKEGEVIRSKRLDRFVDNIFDIFYSKDKTRLYLLIILLLALILRIVAAINLPTSVDAAGHTVMAVNFIDSGKLGDWGQSVGLWDFMTDLSYKVFGMNDISSRFWVILFGGLSVIAIFLLTKELFNKRVGLIAAFLLAISPFHIAETIPEMDVIGLFFGMLGILFFIRGLKKNKKLLFIFSGLMIGVGVLIKIYTLLFIPLLVLYSLYYSIKFKKDKKILLRNLIIFGAAAFIFCLVPIISNYLLWQDKGFVDHIFTETFGLWNNKSQEYFGWIYPYVHEYKFYFFGSLLGESVVHPDMKWPGVIYNYGSPLYAGDRVVLFLGILGLIWLLISKKERKDYLILFLCGLFTLGVYLGSITGLMWKHYLFVLLFMIPPAAWVIDKIVERLKVRWLLLGLLIAILIFQMYWLSVYTYGHFYEKSSLNNLMIYKIKNIPQDSLVVVDSRVFRGYIPHVFQDRHYIESSYFSELVNQQENLPGEYQSLKTYFIECTMDDCGWGTVEDQPEFNQSMESIVEFFKNNSKLEAQFTDSKVGTPSSFSFGVYKTSLMLKSSSLQAVDSTHIFFMYPIGYNEKIAPVFDKYETHTFFQGMLDKIAHWIFWFSALLTIGSVFIVLYLLINDSKNSET